MANSKVTYSKPWIDIADQLTKLTARGLVVANNAEAERFLRYANYYRFSGFCLRFQYWDKPANDRRFIPGTKFEDVVALCKFDSKLRDCISDALEMVELSLRSSIAFHFGKAFGAFGHVNPANFSKSFSCPTPSHASRTNIVIPYKEWRNMLLAETQRSRELFVRHFERQYSQYPDLPIWVVTEICSFGTLSRMYANLKSGEQGAVAKDYGIQFLVLASWLHTFTFVRNVCAHHARLWDKRLSIAPKLPPGKNWSKVSQTTKTVFAVVLMLNWMLAHDSIALKEHSDWKKRIEALLDGFVSRFPMFLGHMGFPPDWKKNPLWWQV